MATILAIDWFVSARSKAICAKLFVVPLPFSTIIVEPILRCAASSVPSYAVESALVT